MVGWKLFAVPPFSVFVSLTIYTFISAYHNRQTVQSPEAWELKGFKDDADYGATIPLYHCIPTAVVDLTSTVSRTKFQKTVYTEFGSS